MESEMNQINQEIFQEIENLNSILKKGFSKNPPFDAIGRGKISPSSNSKNLGGLKNE